MLSYGKNIEGMSKLFLELKKYLELQTEFVKLDAAEKLTVIISTAVIIAVLLVLGSIVLLFLTLAAAYGLGDALGSLPLGFGLVALCVLFLCGIFYWNRNRFVIQPIARFMTGLLITKEHEQQ